MACVFCNTKRHTLTQQKLQLKPSFQRDQSLCLEDHKTNFVLFFNISLAYHYYHVSNFIVRYHVFFHRSTHIPQCNYISSNCWIVISYHSTYKQHPVAHCIPTPHTFSAAHPKAHSTRQAWKYGTNPCQYFSSECPIS